MMRIAVASGKGGTGKTFLSTNLFRTMRNAGLQVAIVDCDAEVPNASLFVRQEYMEAWDTRMFCPEIDREQCMFCGNCMDNCHFHAITCIPGVRYIKVMDDICHGCKVCMHLCPARAISEGWKTIGKVTAYGNAGKVQLLEARICEGGHTPVPVLRDAIDKGMKSGNDYLILDAPPGCSCPFVNTVMDADIVILVTEPTPFGLSDLKHTVDVLRQLDKKFGVVINRADMGDRHVHEYLKAEHIPLLAEIPYLDEVASLYSKGELVVDTMPALQALFIGLMKEIIKDENSNH